MSSFKLDHWQSCQRLMLPVPLFLCHGGVCAIGSRLGAESEPAVPLAQLQVEAASASEESESQDLRAPDQVTQVTSRLSHRCCPPGSL